MSMAKVFGEIVLILKPRDEIAAEAVGQLLVSFGRLLVTREAIERCRREECIHTRTHRHIPTSSPGV
jgi:hypothetical protein